MSQSLVQQVKDDIVQQIREDRLVLPTLPEIALKIREVAEDEDATINDISSIIGQDPALTTRLLRVANSPMLRSSIAINDLTTAVSRLGIDYTSNLVIGLAMAQMFQATNDAIDVRMRECWSRAIEIASSAQVLARHFTKLPSDQALLAGLVHQIGVLPILAYAENNEGLMSDSMSLDHVIERLHPHIGAYILKSWDFSDELVRVPKQYQDLTRKSEQVDFTDIVQVAVIQHFAGTDHPLGQVDRDSLHSFQQLGLDADNVEPQWQALNEEIDATQAAFGSA
ncbi:HDOD domain-containing protein [Thalassolituus sp.]|uniref:HDOD domain-containing protein n=1 Tax=Thalassolituus sp. TaxID=2030822 RepID=UPI002A828FDD|nr:HDOD domain-containing protein [Thalassolituus sp.]